MNVPLGKERGGPQPQQPHHSEAVRMNRSSPEQRDVLRLGTAALRSGLAAAVLEQVFIRPVYHGYGLTDTGTT